MKNPADLLSLFSTEKLPVILQSEVAECGIACIAMISSFHGHGFDLITLRERFPLTLKGATFEDLISIANQIHMISRPLRLELDELSELKTPCILHWDMSHFVVLKEVSKRGIIIHDPLNGVKEVSFEQANKSFTGVALELQPSHKFEHKKEETRFRITDLWSRMDGAIRSLGIILLLSFILQVFMILAPFYTQLVIDEVLVSNDTNLLNLLAVAFLVLMLIQTGVNALRSLIILFLSNQLSIQVGANLFHHLLKLPLSYFERRHLGDLMSRFNSLERIRELLTTTVVETIVDGVMVIATLFMMWYYSIELTTVVIVALILYGLIRVSLFIPIKNATKEQLVTTASKDSSFMETARALQAVKIFNREGKRESLWHNAFAKSLNAGITLGRLNISFTFANQLLFGVENILVIYLGATAIMESSFTVGMLTAFIAYKSQFTQKAGGLIDKIVELRLIKVHLNRVADIALAKKELNDDVVIRPDQKTKGDIELQDISFRFSENEPFVLSNISLKINAGESIAITGKSGCGKSTLLKIIAGLALPTSGEILVDGNPSVALGVKRYNGKMGAVMQNDSLLSGTISENISFFSEVREHARVEKSAKLAALHTDIELMPMKYNTLIGDMGNTLSGGQHQRLLLARAFYQQPRVLFLDEATSHLDASLERFVNKGIKRMNITRIFVAHRQETILSADRVFSLENGLLTELVKSEKI